MSDNLAAGHSGAVITEGADRPGVSRAVKDTRSFDVAALEGAIKVDPSASERSGLVKDMPPITRAGVTLAKTVLWFIAATVVLILVLISFEEFSGDRGYSSAAYSALQGFSRNAPLPSDTAQNTNYQRSIEDTRSLVAEISNERRDTRDFMLRIAQLILLTLFLPILTALLGYIFGTQQAGVQSDRTRP